MDLVGEGKGLIWLDVPASLNDAQVCYVDKRSLTGQLMDGKETGLRIELKSVDNAARWKLYDVLSVVDQETYWEMRISNPVGETTGFEVGERISLSFVRESLGMEWPVVEWVAGEYPPRSVVRDGEYLMISNKTTLERPAPQPVGAPFWASGLGDSPVWSSESVNAAQLITGCLYQFSIGGFSLSYRAWIPVVAGQTYAVWYLSDPSGAPQLSILLPEFTATQTGWLAVPIGRLPITSGTEFGIVLVSTATVQGTQFQANYNYSARNGNPSAGEIYHQNNGVVFRVHKTDADANDQSVPLGSIQLGATITAGGQSWTVVDKSDSTSWIDFSVSPGVRILDGLYSVDFDSTSTDDISFVRILNHYSGVASVSGLYSTTGLSGLVSDDHAYGIDLEVQSADISADWDIAAYSGGAGGSSSGGGSGTDELVAAAPGTIPGYLGTVLAAGTGISVQVDGDNVRVSSLVVNSDELVASAGGQAAGYLGTVLAAGTGISVQTSGANVVVAATGAQTDELVAAQAGQAAGYLGTVLEAGTGISVTTNVDKVRIAATGAQTDELVAAAAGQSPGYLEAVLAAGTGIGLVRVGSTMRIDNTAPDRDERVKATVGGSAGYLDATLAAGTGISLAPIGAGEQIEISATVPPSTDEFVAVSATDTTADYLANKLGVGTGLDVGILNGGANESLILRLADIAQNEILGAPTATGAPVPFEISSLPSMIPGPSRVGLAADSGGALSALDLGRINPWFRPVNHQGGGTAFASSWSQLTITGGSLDTTVQLPSSPSVSNGDRVIVNFWMGGTGVVHFVTSGSTKVCGQADWQHALVADGDSIEFVYRNIIDDWCVQSHSLRSLRFRVGLLVNQAISSGVETPIEWDEVLKFDYGSHSTGDLTCPVQARSVDLMFQCQMQPATVAGNDLRAYIRQGRAGTNIIEMRNEFLMASQNRWMVATRDYDVARNQVYSCSVLSGDPSSRNFTRSGAYMDAHVAAGDRIP